jgi:hypothetical protein
MGRSGEEPVKNLPQARVDLARVDMDAELYLYDERNRLMHQLNPTARQIWEMCDGTHQVEEIVATVARMFPNAPTETVRGDVEKMLDQFADKRLILWAEGDTTGT